jgi:hypothetical protein
MKKLSSLLAIAAIVVAGSAYAANVVQTGVGTGVLENPTDGGCGTLYLNADAGYENGYTWQYAGVVPPQYGAMAECYDLAGTVCAQIFDFTQIGYYAGQTMDAYIWDGGAVPGAVMNVAPGINPGAPAFWPSISRHSVAVSVGVGGPFFTGYWPNWPGAIHGWFVGADLNGFGGCPLTNIAPGIGYPTGWNNVSVVWGPTQAIGLGVELGEGVPVESTTWGQIKNLYN